MSAWYRILFLFSSFGPLYMLLCLELTIQHDWQKTGFRGGGVIGMSVAGAAFLLSFFVFTWLRSGFRANSPSRYKVDPLTSLDENVLTYMLSYFPPLMIDDFSSTAKVVPAIMFYVVMTAIMFCADTMYVNPYFLLFGYRIYRVKLPSARSVILVTRKTEVRPDELLNLYEIQPSRLFYAD